MKQFKHFCIPSILNHLLLALLLPFVFGVSNAKAYSESPNTSTKDCAAICAELVVSHAKTQSEREEDVEKCFNLENCQSTADFVSHAKTQSEREEDVEKCFNFENCQSTTESNFWNPSTIIFFFPILMIIIAFIAGVRNNNRNSDGYSTVQKLLLDLDLDD
ncbi:MAG: hypothetical protein ACLFTJ_04635 [Halothece sp.]